MNVLVTGATGFLGRHLCEALKMQRVTVFEVGSKQCDLTKRESLNRFNSIQFDQIYHLAAWTQAGDFCLNHPGEQWVINQKINTNILDWWAASQRRAKMICIGTSCSYDPDELLVEENYLKGTPISSLYTYAMTKRMLLVGLLALQKQYDLEFLYLIPSTLYGKGYHTDGRQMHFIFDLVRKILRGSLYHEPVVLWGNGDQKRELIHVADFIGALLELVHKEKNTWINIGSGEEHSIREFASLICGIVGFPEERIQFDLNRYVGAKSKVLNINRLRSVLPTFSSRSLKSGLEEVVHWFREKEKLLLPQNIGVSID